jgi:putative endonuclease
VTSDPRLTGPARATSAETGRAGEEHAARYLRERGFTILERGFRTRDGEIDLVAADREEIVFVEVKTRSGLSHGRPAESIDGRKRYRLLKAARIWLHRHGATDRPCRFDVVEVFSHGPDQPRVEHIADAFRDEA